MKTIEASWYDHPQYYDLAFRSDTKREARFIEAACKRFGCRPLRRLLEPACGTGRLVAELAGRGYRVTGLDLSRPALDYLGKRLTRRGLKATLIQGDMTDFRLKRPVDAAYCLLNSFRHLTSEEAARRHLRCVANHLPKGGIYLLGFHLLPPDASLEATERWTEKHGKTQTSVTLRVLESSRRERIEQLRISVLVRSPSGQKRLRDEFPLRLYNAAQVRQLLAAVGDFELCEVYDFWFDINEPQKFDNNLVDAVFVLRKR